MEYKMSLTMYTALMVEFGTVDKIIEYVNATYGLMGQVTKIRVG